MSSSRHEPKRGRRRYLRRAPEGHSIVRDACDVRLLSSGKGEPPEPGVLGEALSEFWGEADECDEDGPDAVQTE